VFGVDAENALGTGANRGFDASEVTVSLAGVLERGGKLDARRALAQANIDAIAPQREVTRLDLMAEVARRYLAVTAARGQRRIAFDQLRRGSAARHRLQPQRAAAGEQIQHPRTGQPGHQPVEQGLAHAVAGRAQALQRRHLQPRIAPAATDDAHLPFPAMRGTPGSRGVESWWTGHAAGDGNGPA